MMRPDQGIHDDIPLSYFLEFMRTDYIFWRHCKPDGYHKAIKYCKTVLKEGRLARKMAEIQLSPWGDDWRREGVYSLKSRVFRQPDRQGDAARPLAPPCRAVGVCGWRYPSLAADYVKSATRAVREVFGNR